MFDDDTPEMPDLVARRDQPEPELPQQVADILNFALTLEYLEDEFYRTALAQGGLIPDYAATIVGKADLKGLPPATVITDQIDPLQSEGQALAAKLKKAGVQVDAHNYDGVTHEFFGIGMVVGKAKQAEDVAIKNLKDAFGRNS